MLIPLNHPALEGKSVTVKTPGLWKGPAILVNDDAVKKEKGNIYRVRSLSGQEVEIKMKPSILDPIPKLEINGEKIELARPLAWYEIAWSCLPVLLIFGGGALGGGLGAGAAYINARLFRSDLPVPAKYAATFGTATLAWILYFAIAIPISIILGR